MKITSILYVEDEKNVREALGFFLQRFCQNLYIASSGKEGLDFFHKYNPDLIITDIKMPNMNGLSMVQAIKELNEEIPVIFTTAHSENEYTLEAIDLQVDGYILKPIDLKKLAFKLNQIIRNLLLKQDFDAHHKLLESMAYKDVLTGIYNRRRFNEELQREVKRFNRTDEVFSLIMFDIDFFKKFNDKYGHKLGDNILVEISRLVLKNIRELDLFARWGGEEFVILLPDTSVEEAIVVAESMKNKICKYNFIQDLKITASFGVTESIKNDSCDLLEKRVDTALYRAKTNGRNRVEV